jgi:hypothetical protein
MGHLATLRIGVAIFVALVTGPAPGSGAPPRSFNYSFYVSGQRVGGAAVRVAEDPSRLLLESTYKVTLGESVIDLKTRTEADPKTFAVRRFSYEGTRGGLPAQGAIAIEGDSAFFFSAKSGDRPRKRRRIQPAPIVLWEDWVPDLQILLARQAVEPTSPTETGLLLASAFIPSTVIFGYTGEVALESRTSSMVGRKLEVLIQGGAPFESYVDPKRGVPVCIRFPATATEIFLDEFYGENPTTLYRPASKVPSEP